MCEILEIQICQHYSLLSTTVEKAELIHSSSEQNFFSFFFLLLDKLVSLFKAAGASVPVCTRGSHAVRLREQRCSHPGPLHPTRCPVLA